MSAANDRRVAIPKQAMLLSLTSRYRQVLVLTRPNPCGLDHGRKEKPRTATNGVRDTLIAPAAIIMR